MVTALTCHHHHDHQRADMQAREPSGPPNLSSHCAASNSSYSIVPGEFPHKGQWRGALMFSLICVWINDWVNNREAGDLRRYRTHYDVIVMLAEKHFYTIRKLCSVDIWNHHHFCDYYKIARMIRKDFCLFGILHILLPIVGLPKPLIPKSSVLTSEYNQYHLYQWITLFYLGKPILPQKDMITIWRCFNMICWHQ